MRERQVANLPKFSSYFFILYDNKVDYIDNFLINLLKLNLKMIIKDQNFIASTLIISYLLTTTLY